VPAPRPPYLLKGVCAGTPPVPEPEHWRPVRGWEGLYEVSDLGQVRSPKRKGGNNRWYGGKILIAYPNKGYPVVPLCWGSKRTMTQVHRVVLEAFGGPCPPGMVACHGNGSRGDPRLSNLRWGTPPRQHGRPVHPLHRRAR